MSVSAAYVFSRAIHLPIFNDSNLAPSTTTKSYDILSASGATAQTYTVPFYTNRLDTGTGIITMAYPAVNSWYNSFVLTARKQIALRPRVHGQLYAEQVDGTTAR